VSRCHVVIQIQIQFTHLKPQLLERGANTNRVDVDAEGWLWATVRQHLCYHDIKRCVLGFVLVHEVRELRALLSFCRRAFLYDFLHANEELLAVCKNQQEGLERSLDL